MTLSYNVLMRGTFAGKLSRAFLNRAQQQLGLNPTRDSLESLISILPNPLGFDVPGIVVLEHPCIRQLLDVAKTISIPRTPLYGSVPFHHIENEGVSTINNSIPCTLRTMAAAVGEDIPLAYIESKIAPSDSNIYDAFDTFVEKHGLGTRVITGIDGALLLKIARQEVVLVMTLNPDDYSDKWDDRQTVLVLGARSISGTLELLVANSYPPYPIEGKIEDEKPNLAWFNAVNLAEQCVSIDPNADTVKVFILNRSTN